MEDMRPVNMDLDSLHVLGIDVTRNRRALIHDKDLLPRFCRFPRKNRAVQSRSDDQIIIHEFFLHGCTLFPDSNLHQYKSSV